ILIQDDPGSKEGVAKAMVPALARHGLTPAAQIVYPELVDSPWTNYMLQLQSAGVTHVLWAASHGPLPVILAMQAADNQHYQPKWGAGSDQYIGALLGAGAPRAQLVNTWGMGWIPSLDISQTTGTNATSASAAAC